MMTYLDVVVHKLLQKFLNIYFQHFNLLSSCGHMTHHKEQCPKVYLGIQLFFMYLTTINHPNKGSPSYEFLYCFFTAYILLQQVLTDTRPSAIMLVYLWQKRILKFPENTVYLQSNDTFCLASLLLHIPHLQKLQLKHLSPQTLLI